MSAVDEILSQVPLDQLAQQVGSDPATTETAARGAIQALLGGMEANAQDPAGEASLAEALGQHDPSLIEGGVDLGQVDPADGQKIVSHIFGANEGEVTQRLGAVGGLDQQAIVKKLLPILAPIVLAYLAKRLSGQGGLAGMLGGILGGMANRQQQGQGDQNQQGGAGGLDLGSILGGLLGGGRR